MPSVGGPSTRIANPTWRTAPILEKSKKLSYLCNGLTDRHEIWHDDANWPSWPFRPLKFWPFKNPRWGSPPSWKIATSRRRFDRSPRNLAGWRIYFDLIFAVKIIQSFQNPRWRTTVILKMEKNRDISITVWRFGTVTHIDPLYENDQPLKLRTLTLKQHYPYTYSYKH